VVGLSLLRCRIEGSRTRASISDTLPDSGTIDQGDFHPGLVQVHADKRRISETHPTCVCLDLWHRNTVNVALRSYSRKGIDRRLRAWVGQSTYDNQGCWSLA
jgi:hypothetical protein